MNDKKIVLERPNGSYIKTVNGELKIKPKNICDTFNMERYCIKYKDSEYYYYIDKNKDNSIHTELFSSDGNSIKDKELIKKVLNSLDTPS
jgi:hypothetical protein